RRLEKVIVVCKFVLNYLIKSESFIVRPWDRCQIHDRGPGRSSFHLPGIRKDDAGNLRKVTVSAQCLAEINDGILAFTYDAGVYVHQARPGLRVAAKDTAPRNIEYSPLGPPSCQENSLNFGHERRQGTSGTHVRVETPDCFFD